MQPAMQSFVEHGPEEHKVPNFTAELVQRLLSLIETPKSNFDKILGNHVWLLDSGASCHMTGIENFLHNVCNIEPIPVEWPNKTTTLAVKKGSVYLNPKLQLRDVLYVPNLKGSLISIAQLINDIYCTVTFTPKLCVIQHLTTRNLIGVARPRNGVYFYKDTMTDGAQVNKISTYELWHRHLGHPSHQVLFNFSNSIQNIPNSKSSLCDVCCRAKQTRASFPVSENNAINCFNLIYYDIWGAYCTKSFCDAQYFLTILDDATRGVWVYLMESDASQIVNDFCAMVETRFETRVKNIRSDNGSEFTLGPIKKFYAKKGMMHQTSCVDTPQQNNRVEIKHRHTLGDVARALNFQANLPIEFWGIVPLQPLA